MIFNIVDLVAERPTDLDTEIKFAIASARVDNIELLRFDMNREADDFIKFYNYVLKILRKMKSSGHIQFMATPSAFSNSDREAEFLKNKYSDYLKEIPNCSDQSAYVFVKL